MNNVPCHSLVLHFSLSSRHYEWEEIDPKRKQHCKILFTDILYMYIYTCSLYTVGFVFFKLRLVATGSASAMLYWNLKCSGSLLTSPEAIALRSTQHIIPYNQWHAQTHTDAYLQLNEVGAVTLSSTLPIVATH